MFKSVTAMELSCDITGHTHTQTDTAFYSLLFYRFIIEKFTITQTPVCQQFRFPMKVQTNLSKYNHPSIRKPINFSRIVKFKAISYDCIHCK